MHEQHTRAMPTQVEIRTSAAANRNQSFNANHGRPAEVVSSRPVAATPGIVAPPVRGGFGGNRPADANTRPVEMNRPGQPVQRRSTQQQVTRPKSRVQVSPFNLTQAVPVNSTVPASPFNLSSQTRNPATGGHPSRSAGPPG